MGDWLLDDLSRRYMKVDYRPVAIDAYRAGNTGIPFVWTLDSGRPGPHAVICAIVHGNEIAGAVVLDRLLRERTRPTIGKLSFCFGNPQAYAQFDHLNPHQSREVDIDLNRVWGGELGDANRQEVEIRRARELRPLFEDADYLLDLHTTQAPGPATAVVQDTGRTLDLARRLEAIPIIVTGEVHDTARVRLRNFGRFGDPSDFAVAIQVEAGQHWQSETVDVAMTITHQFLETISLLPAIDRPPGGEQLVLNVIDILRCDGPGFAFQDDFANGAFFADSGTLIATEGEREIRTPVDDCYLIMPVHFRRHSGTIGRFAVRDRG